MNIFIWFNYSPFVSILHVVGYSVLNVVVVGIVGLICIFMGSLWFIGDKTCSIWISGSLHSLSECGRILPFMDF